MSSWQPETEIGLIIRFKINFLSHSSSDFTQSQVFRTTPGSARYLTFAALHPLGVPSYVLTVTIGSTSTDLTIPNTGSSTWEPFYLQFTPASSETLVAFEVVGTVNGAQGAVDGVALGGHHVFSVTQWSDGPTCL